MSPATAHEPQLRMRVFAGPNGSGKSTIIHAVRNTTIAGRKLDVGYYINADDIAGKLLTNSFNFSEYKLDVVFLSRQCSHIRPTWRLCKKQ